ncbi:MAG TPA: ATP-binding protein [Candidatus Dormibacteraeota bacterium]|nr:ATP-binding protein [Candidatus Dormibacteraeota bacterium]
MAGSLAPSSVGERTRQAAEIFFSLDLAPTGIACTTLAAEVIGARLGKLYLLGGAGTPRLLAELSGGSVSTRESRTRLPRAQVQRLRDAAAGTRPVLDDAPGSVLQPVRVGQRPIGVFLLEELPSGRPTNEEVSELIEVARLSGIALENALLHREVHQRAERLADLERAKSQFLNLASHELRGPLTVLMGYLSLLEDHAFGDVPDELAKVLPAINARIAEMDALINAMLETARLEDDRLELAVADEDLRELAADAVGRVEPFAKPGQQIALQQPDDRVPVSVDRARIVLVVGNLLHNALKYSVQHTDVHCEVRIDGEEALVTVRDDGIGIAAQDMRTLFTRFGRVRSDPAVRTISGTGLGLYLARELARAHGGEITAESEPGVGSTFTLHLPISR